MLSGVVLIIVGLALSALSGYGVWWLVSTIIKGITTNNWLMVIGGGILTYLAIGLLIVAFVVGLAIIIGGVDEL